MITTITFNPALDKTYYLPSYEEGATIRVTETHDEPGGKGINVAKVLHGLGCDVLTTGFIGGITGSKIQKLLNERDVKHDFIVIDSESRICLNLVNKANGQETEILELGPGVTEYEWSQLLIWQKERLSQSSFVVLSGSLPKGVSPQKFRQFIHLLKKANHHVVVDSSGEAFSEAIKEKPFLIKPNMNEINKYLHTDLQSEHDFMNAALSLHQKGVTHVCISLGGKGAIYAGEKGVYRLFSPQVNVVNTVGCGDAMVAGLVAGFQKSLSLEQTLSLAIACGASNAECPYAGIINKARVESLIQRVEVQRY